jgi:hypothetical protein
MLIAGLWIRIGSGFRDFVDPDPDTLWIRIHIGNPDLDPGARKLRNFSRKKYFLGIFKQKIYHWKGVK